LGRDTHISEENILKNRQAHAEDKKTSLTFLMKEIWGLFLLEC